MTEPEPELSVRNCSFTYPEYPGVQARGLFEDLNLELGSGELAIVLGRPDQGKTTLCRILAGLIPRFSGGELTGSLRIAGRLLLESEPYELVEEVGLVFQHPGEQLLTSRCDSEVAFALESLGMPRVQIEKKVVQALQAMDLSRYKERSPQLLSGGEKKKLLIACLLAVDPRLWLLDETLEELDRETRMHLLTLLRERRRTTLILSAKWHDLFRDFADRFFLLDQGKMRELDQPHDSQGFRDLLAEHGFILPMEAQGAVRPAAGVRADRSTLLEVRELYFRYSGEAAHGDCNKPRVVPAAEAAFDLQIDSLQLQEGSRTAVVGDNGSGKSTLGRLLCGLLTPLRGEIRTRARGALQTAAAEELNRFSGYLFQDPDLQIFLPTVADELALGLKRMGIPAGQIGRRVDRAISLFGLPQGDAAPALMSYGMRKKLQAAVYYLLERPLMIIDEGDSGLSTDDFASIIRLFGEQAGALIFITHDHRLASALADAVIELKRGRLA